MNVCTSNFTGDVFFDMYHRVAKQLDGAPDIRAVAVDTLPLHIPTGVSRQVVRSA